MSHTGLSAFAPRAKVGTNGSKALTGCIGIGAALLTSVNL